MSSDQPPSAEKIVTAAVLVIGNEILSGRTQDVNLNYLAKGLNEVGVTLREARVIPDVEATIIATVNELRGKFDYLFTTGGIGPTHDDITSECVAKAFGLPWTLHPEAERVFLAGYRPDELNDARRRMAHTPEGASLIYNPVSRAPGFRIENVFVMAGVPRVMQGMFDGLKHDLQGGRPMLSRSVGCTLAEGALAKALGDIQKDFPDLDIGSYPIMRRGVFGVNLVLRGRDPARLEAGTAAVAEMVRGLGDSPVVE